MRFELAPEWVHVQYQEAAKFTEVYGFAGTQGVVNCEGVRFVPKGKPSKTLAVFMHPSSTLQLLPMPQALARAGVHVLCAGSRFAKNDTPLIMEKVLSTSAPTSAAQGGVGLREGRAVRLVGRRIARAFLPVAGRKPFITETPAGDPVELKD